MRGVLVLVQVMLEASRDVDEPANLQFVVTWHETQNGTTVLVNAKYELWGDAELSGRAFAGCGFDVESIQAPVAQRVRPGAASDAS